MKIDLLVGENSYGTVIHFSKSLAKALQKRGAETRLFWVGEGNFFHAFYAIMEDPPDFTLSFSDISAEGTPLADLWQIPHCTLLLDPPIYFLHQLKSRLGHISCVDALDCNFVKALGFERSFFLPHGADPEDFTPVDRPRPHKAVFFGTCVDPEEVRGSWPKEEQEILSSASELVLSDSGLSILHALLHLGVCQEKLARYHGEVDRYARAKDRLELIRSLGDYPIEIWGEGPWEKFFPKHQVHPPLHFDQIVATMKKSEWVLNSSPRFKQGAHERIFYALMCGAAVHTGKNPYISQEFPFLETYTFGSCEPPVWERREEVAMLGQQKVASHHTWEARATTLLDQLNFLYS